MSKNREENSAQNTDKNVDKESVQNPTNRNTMDLNSIMQLASNLLKNDSLMNTVTELNKKKKNPALPVSSASVKQEYAELISLSDELENIKNNISVLKQENAELASLSQKVENIANDFSQLTQEIKDVKEQNNDLIKLLKKIMKNNKK